MTDIDFYFDFSSPYGYFGSELIGEIACRHGVKVNWKPVWLGVIFKETKSAPLVAHPVKGPYFRHDFQRSAEFHGIRFQEPPVFPVASRAAACAFYWLHDQDPIRAITLAQSIYRAYFTEGINISEVDAVLTIGEKLGIERAELASALDAPVLAERVMRETTQAQAMGVFGSPFFIYNGESFWGADRLPQLEFRLKQNTDVKM